MAEQQPEQEMVWYGLANEYVKLECWADAADALDRVVKLNADFTAAYQMLGTALLNQGQREAARESGRKGSKWQTARARGKAGSTWKVCWQIQKRLSRAGSSANDELTIASLFIAHELLHC